MSYQYGRGRPPPNGAVDRRYAGRTVIKPFGNRLVRGKVHIVGEKSSAKYLIKYDSGDCEEMSPNEVEEHLVMTHKSWDSSVRKLNGLDAQDDADMDDILLATTPERKEEYGGEPSSGPYPRRAGMTSSGGSSSRSGSRPGSGNRRARIAPSRERRESSPSSPSSSSSSRPTRGKADSPAAKSKRDSNSGGGGGGGGSSSAADDDDDDKPHPDDKPSACVIDPGGKSKVFSQRWDVLMIILLAFTAIVTPFEVAFLETAIDFLFVLNRCVCVVDIYSDVERFVIGFFSSLDWDKDPIPRFGC